ncbi:radical SAM protein [Paracoccus sp. (in: a-proteobacteria)]|uniref:radical SAM protein n=1 Tax=Paracoccus sp. TaxID=267 RepID=UPI0026E10CD3|nr:radical SAM protein [Paracoccus sp. (in: a-proteobacteria)]MDO5368911.1 radical SAM protein [Paracoccus sp. (in: a-proteobacteria)]
MTQVRRQRSIDIVAKITERCNLACTYCYFFFGGDETWLRHSAVMKPATIEALAGFLARGARELELDDIYLGLHGGEPLLMKKPAFDAMCSRLKAAMPERTRLYLGVQTNGMLIDAEWIDLFEKHEVGIGISLDGPAAVNDRARIDKKGRGSHARVLQGLRIAQEAARAGRIAQPGCLCVIDPDQDPAEVYDHLIGELGFASVSFLLPREGHDTGMRIDAGKWRGFMRRLVAHWTDPATPTVPMRILSEPLKGMISDEGAAWRDMRIANRHNVITVTSDGELGPDDNLKGQDPRFQETGMSVFDTTLGEFIESPLWQGIVTGIDQLPQRCRGCDWRRVCGGGDVFNRYSRAHGFSRESVFCDALDEMHLELARYAAGHGILADEIAERLSRPPSFRASNLAEARHDARDVSNERRMGLNRTDAPVAGHVAEEESALLLRPAGSPT